MPANEDQDCYEHQKHGGDGGQNVVAESGVEPVCGRRCHQRPDNGVVALLPDWDYIGLARFPVDDDMAAPKLLIATFLPHIIVLLYYLSYRISCKLYLKGTEEYDA